ncbi:hypothetical protein LEQ41_10770 [Streptococcus agalactiae]|nr:hypothetical protein [Streptococcus agalactiae]
MITVILKISFSIFYNHFSNVLSKIIVIWVYSSVWLVFFTINQEVLHISLNLYLEKCSLHLVYLLLFA